MKKKSVKMPEDGNVEPYDKEEVSRAKKAMASTNKTVKPVAKDTNKTRRKTTRARTVGVTAKTVAPKSNLKKDMHKSMKGKC